MRGITRHLLLVVAMAFFLAGCGGDPVLIATEGKYHPYNFVNEQGEIDGLERKLGDELCRRADLDCEWVIADWDSMIPDLIAGRFDVILAGMSITEKREQHIDFTEAYYPPTPSLYLARSGSTPTPDLGKVGVSEPTIYSDHFLSEGRSFMGYPTTQDLAEVLLAGEVDVILVDHGYGVEKLSELDALTLVREGPLLDRGLGMGIRQDGIEPGSRPDTQGSGGELKNRLNTALRSMKEDGSLNELILKWVGEEASLFE